MSEQIEQLQKELEKAQGAERARCLNDLSNAYWYISPQKSINLGIEALELSRALSDQIQEAQALRCIGAGYGISGDYPRAIDFYNQSLELEVELENIDGVASCQNNIAVNYSLMGQKERALDYYLQALRGFEEISHPVGISTALGNIGVIYKEWGNDDRARNYLSRALGLSESADDQDGVAEWVNELGEIEFSHGQYETAYIYFQRCLNISTRISNRELLASAYRNMGEYFIVKQKYDQALEYFVKTRDVYEEMGKRDGVAEAFINLGRVALLTGDMDESQQYLKQGLDLARQINARELLQKSYCALSDLFAAKEDYHQALSCFRRHAEIKDSIFGEQAGQRIAELQTKFETEKKEREAEVFRIKTVELADQVQQRTAELNRSRNELKHERDLFVNGPVVVVRWVHAKGQKTQIEYISPNISQFGYDGEDFKNGRTILEDMIHPDDFERTISDLRRMIQNEVSSWEQEYRVCDTESNIYWIYSLNRSFLDDDNPQLRIFTSYMMNITELKRVQEELRQKQAQLAHSGRLASLGEMATGVAHELNQPLAIIRMQAEILKLSSPVDASGEVNSLQDLDEIILQVDRAAAIIDHMKGFAHVQTDVTEPVDLNTSINRALVFFREQFRIHSIVLKIDLAGNLPILHVNAQKIEQIVVNFLSNARFAVDRRIQLEDTDYSGAVHLTTKVSKDKKWVIFEIIDNGVGMNSEELQRCLEPFYTTKDVGQGTGLGLTIVNNIINEFKGRMEIISKQGSGTTIHVRIPINS